MLQTEDLARKNREDKRSGFGGDGSGGSELGRDRERAFGQRRKLKKGHPRSKREGGREERERGEGEREEVRRG